MIASLTINSLDSVRRLLGELPGPDRTAMAAARTREACLTKPEGALGRLEELTVWLSGWQCRHPPRCESVRAAIFAGNHGLAAHGVSAYPQAVTAQMVDAALKGEEVPINNTTTYTNGVKYVPSYLLVPHSVDISNWEELLIDSGYYTMDQIQ